MSKKDLFFWNSSFTKAKINDEIKQNYLRYIEVLLNNKVPIIFDFFHLTLLLGRNSKYLSSVVNSNISHYREFEIPKKKGGTRKITAPYPALLDCQRWIYNNILKNIKIHPCAQGFTKKKSIITNAKIHVNQDEFLKIDIKDFFPSITINQVINIFKSFGYTQKVSFYLASICCYDQNLPQGAPTSPILSNLVAITLDKRLFAFAKKFDLKYTRYADDLAFSGKKITSKHLEYIKEIISECGFEANDEKTFLQQKKSKRIITGISISDNTIKVPKQYKRKLKQEVHFIRKFGALNVIRRNKIKNPNYLYSIIGKLNFWMSVEPNNQFAKKAYNDLKQFINYN
ncbi:RNA-dependent DNA polymerase [Chryseobacterium sp. MYb7]|uniref:retron St85 family RNA-directed DNA polymerase n=1 Tax=Chryseobacterium sp. MYb7 TaxID=1827290 RepID=UPI000CFEA3CF|nr:retron St85 family RNA-directed DNA polymerase [Chryseobacterium sp. MYb7]PRB02043.1 RNA-dependent DNA polymerase [Chryseobacterium sp. MYb7]